MERRNEIANYYFDNLRNVEGLALPEPVEKTSRHAFHLYVVQLTGALQTLRNEIYQALRAEGIGANVHYQPVYHLSYYRKNLGLEPGLCPIAEKAAEGILSLPLFPGMSDQDKEDVVTAVKKISDWYTK